MEDFDLVFPAFSQNQYGPRTRFRIKLARSTDQDSRFQSNGKHFVKRKDVMQLLTI